MSNEYDRLLKEIFGPLKTTLVKLLFGIDIVEVKPLTGKLQQSIIEKEADIVAEIITSKGEHFVLHIEWQTINDQQMAERMLLYNILFRLKHHKPVLGAVIYLGKEKLRMQETIQSFGLNYQVAIKDVRDINPIALLDSTNPSDWIFTILAGHAQDKTNLIRKILFKLHAGLKGKPEQLKINLKQLEILSLLRGKETQQQILKEEQTMPVTIDITQDLRYQAGIEKGIKQGIEKGIEKGAEMEKKVFVRNLLEQTTHSITEIAVLAAVSEDFVRKVKKAKSIKK